jgi:hypothetical protein
MDWEQTIKEGESTLLYWYRLITQSGHGHIEVGDICLDCKQSLKIIIEENK